MRRRTLVLVVCLAVLAPSFVFAPPVERAEAAGSGRVEYSNDALGRLTGVVDALGAGARYRYDTVGNITGIDRFAATQVSVIDFFPRVGKAGGQMSIAGTGFSATPSGQTVKIGGVNAPVVASNGARLTVTIPSGVVSGAVRVTASAGTANSITNFLLTPASPTASGISTRVAGVGEQLTVTGAGFETTAQDNALRLNGTYVAVTTASATSMTATVPRDATSGLIQVGTPNGYASLSGYVYVPPYPLTAANVDDTIAVSVGTQFTLAMDAANKVSLAAFEATSGQRLSMLVSSDSFGSCNRDVSIMLADATVRPAGFCSAMVDAFDVPRTGTNTVVLDPGGTLTGSITATVYNIVDYRASIAADGVQRTVPITVPGQNAYLTFSGTAGARISMLVGGIGGLTNSSSVRISNPDGTVLAENLDVFSYGWFTDLLVLPQSGTYTVSINPGGAIVQDIGVTLYTVPPDFQGTTAPDGVERIIPITVPAQNGYLTFAGSTGNQVSMVVGGIGSLTTSSLVRISNPDGSVLIENGDVFSHGWSTGTLTLPQTGTYTIFVNPAGTIVQDVRVTLSTVSGFTAGEGNEPPDSVGEPTDPPPAGTDVPTSPDGTDVTVPSGQSTSADEGSPDSSAEREAALAAEEAARQTPVPEPEVRDPSLESTDSAAGSWVPTEQSRREGWRFDGDQPPVSIWEPLRAAGGLTALSGLVLDLDDRPLAGIEIAVGEASTVTDGTGRFLLELGEPSGLVELVVDGSAAARNRRYGVFEIGYELTAGETNVVEHAIYLPRVDRSEAHAIPAVIETEVVIASLEIPGLELHLLPGSRVVDGDGNPVTELSITAIPINRTPFALPPLVEVPVYFTIQPGGAYVEGPGAQLWYPNYSNLAPGTRVDFWNYEPEEGWHIYGQGTVTPDGAQIVPDPGVAIYEFSGAMINSGRVPPAVGPCEGPCAADGDPVDLATGLFVLDSTDFLLPDTMPLGLTRSYRQGDSDARAFGIGSSHIYDLFLWSGNGYQEATLVMPDGGRFFFFRTSPGVGFSDAAFEHTATQSIFHKATLVWNGSGWTLTLQNGSTLWFGDSGPLYQIKDRFGNIVHIRRAGVNSFGAPIGNITTIRSPDGRWLEFGYDASSRVTSAKDNLGRQVTYTYDTSGRLATATGPSGTTSYTYDSSHRMLTVTDARNNLLVTNTYDANGRVATQRDVANALHQFAYTLGGTGQVVSTRVTDPLNNVREVTFDGQGYPVTDTVAVGTTLAQTATFTRTGSLLESVVDHLGRRTSFVYDSRGNVTSVTSLAETPEAVTVAMTYGGFGLPTSYTNPENETTTASYDARGRLVSITDPLNHTTTFTSDYQGHVLTTTGPLTDTTTYRYDFGNLVEVTDAIGRQASAVVDGAGRVRQVSSLNGPTRLYYDAANLLTRSVDPLGGTTVMTYDLNGNLLTLTDAKASVTRWVYNTLNQVTTRTDPLNRNETYLYDLEGRVTQATDRRGTVTAFTYDPLGRNTFTGFGRTVDGQGQVTYASTVTATYDGGNRLTSLVDTAYGTVTFGYDGLDRLTAETTPAGSVTYTYDRASRPTSTTPSGLTATAYDWDEAGRLIEVESGTSTVGFSYNTGDRLTAMTLSNGATADYGYNLSGDLTGITYRNPTGGLLGDLTYTYNNVAATEAVAGTLAAVTLPTAVSTSQVVLDAAHQVTRWGSSTLTYDLAGNTTRFGTRYMTWDARGQMATLKEGSGGNAPTTTYSYDPLGRRVSAVRQGVTSSWRWDGWNLLTETQAGTQRTFVSGLGLDGVLSSTLSGASTVPLRDRIGSVVAITNSSGTNVGTDTYTPHGVKTATGTQIGTLGFVGREHDPMGFQPMRNRTYSPELGRFLSEDPLGLPAGINPYVYAANDPLATTDRTGLDPIDLVFLGWGLYDLFTGEPKDFWTNLGMLGLDIAFLLIPIVPGLHRIDDIGDLAKHADDLAEQAARRADDVVDASRRAPNAGAMVDDAVGGIDDAFRNACSFSADTRVLMADGTIKPISEVQVGDWVWAEAPQTGVRGARQVMGVWTHEDTLVSLRLGNGGVTTTEDHPFWNETDQAWQPTDALDPGDKLRTADGRNVQVVGIEPDSRATATSYNLTVDGLHSYYISIGQDEVLVHNTCGEMISRPSQIAARLGVSTRQVNDAIHSLKENLPSGAPKRNPDVVVDINTGEVYPKIPGGGFGDSLGNILDLLFGG